jgi:hypothetical protein
MPTISRTISSGNFFRANALMAFAALLLVAALPCAARAQQNAPQVAAEHAAMQKLDFLAGHWNGPITVHTGSGAVLHMTQTEHVQFKLSGLVMLVQGKSTTADDKVMFNALATIAYDETTHSYHIRAYNDGRYIDTELSVVPDGFSWGFPAGPVHVMNTMHLTGNGEWKESTSVTFGQQPPMQTVSMLLTRQPSR